VSPIFEQPYACLLYRPKNETSAFHNKEFFSVGNYLKNYQPLINSSKNDALHNIIIYPQIRMPRDSP
jgi:hypothetical protein